MIDEENDKNCIIMDESAIRNRTDPNQTGQQHSNMRQMME